MTEGESVAGDLTDATEEAAVQSDAEIIEPEPVVEPEPEPQPPSPAPEGNPFSLFTIQSIAIPGIFPGVTGLVNRCFSLLFLFSSTELWSYLKDTVCSNNPLSVDDLVDKLMTAVTAIPQPLLKSVVKDTIKKQKSLDEGKTEAGLFD